MNHRFVSGRLVAILLGVVLGSVPVVRAASEDGMAPAYRPSAVTELDAKVVTVDVANRRLKVKDVHDQEVTLQIMPETIISSGSSSKLVLKDLKPKDKVLVYYTTADMKARQIDVSPNTPILRDLETR